MHSTYIILAAVSGLASTTMAANTYSGISGLLSWSATTNATKNATTGPFGIPGSAEMAAFAKPLASHTWSVSGPGAENITSKYGITVAVADVPLEQSTQYAGSANVSTQVALSLTDATGAGADSASLAGIGLCYHIWQQTNQTLNDLAKADNGNCSTIMSDTCLSALRSQGCGSGQTWPSSWPDLGADSSSVMFGKCERPGAL
jgi:hypothetical protein